MYKWKDINVGDKVHYRVGKKKYTGVVLEVQNSVAVYILRDEAVDTKDAVHICSVKKIKEPKKPQEPKIVVPNIPKQSHQRPGLPSKKEKWKLRKDKNIKFTQHVLQRKNERFASMSVDQFQESYDNAEEVNFRNRSRKRGKRGQARFLHNPETKQLIIEASDGSLKTTYKYYRKKKESYGKRHSVDLSMDQSSTEHDLDLLGEEGTVFSSASLHRIQKSFKRDKIRSHKKKRVADIPKDEKKEGTEE